jgi:hypothetical protein
VVIAAPADVVAAWRPLTDEEALVASTRLATTERWIRKRITAAGRDLAAELAADAALPDDDPDKGFRQEIVDVQVEAVLRVMMNPDRLRSESIDDHSFTRDRTISDGTLRITAEEWARLGITTSPSARKAFMIDTTPDAALVYPRLVGWNV